MSTTTTNTEVLANDFQAIELEPIGYPAPVITTPNRKSLDNIPAQDVSAESLTRRQTGTSITALEISRWKATVIIITVACVTLVQNMLGGILVVALPTMAVDLGLSNDLLLWPASVSALASGCTLLVSGSITDVIGGRKIYLTGAFFLTLTTIASGLSRNGIELILFRAAQGIALSLILPSSVKLITSNIPSGTGRNIAFACRGAAQPVGFSVGLVMGGLFIQSIGWRWGYYIGALVTFGVFIISVFFIPAESNAQNQSYSMILSRMKSEIDWIGCLLLSTSLGMFSYVLSVLSGGASHFLEPASLALFSIAVALLPAFAVYSRRQERLNRKVIIPPSIWNNRVFTSLCVTVFVMSGVFDAIVYFFTLFFQSVQGLSGLRTSIRFLPMIVTGAATNLLTGWLVKRTRADILILGSTLISAISPLLMAIIKPEWTYFNCAFFAVSCAPICADVLFTVANLVITSVFRPESHGLAGGVFNTLSNVGNSFGLAITAVIASGVTMAEHNKNETVAGTLMDGYRVTYWVCFAANLLVLGVITFGLRKIGKVGIKQD